MNKKLKKIHIFDKVWLIGKPNKLGNHAVIYGPDKKEYDLTKDWIDYLHTQDECEYENINNRWNLGRVKVYVLSQILEPRKWNFDINIIPDKNSRIKVIYKNGTIKNIDSFSGNFENHKLPKIDKYPTLTNPEWSDWHNSIRKDGEKMPSQFIWTEKTTYTDIEAWAY